MARWTMSLGVVVLVACGGAGNDDLFSGSGTNQSTTPSDQTPPSSTGTTPPGTPPPPPPGVTPPPPGPPPPGCTPVAYYRDKDGDGVGGTTKQMACTPPGNEWVTTTGDCDDEDPDVHPGQTTYFPAPYQRPNGTFSFDYDCSTAEDQRPPARHLAGTCQLAVGGAGCIGDGYIPQSTNRSGPGVDPLCGPVQKQTCVLKTTGQPGCNAVITSAEPTSCR